MSFELCTHPDTWECKQSEAGCVGQIKYEAWIAADVEIEKAAGAGRRLYFTPKPDLVGNVDMTHVDDKLPLGHVGPAAPCCDAPGEEHTPGCRMARRNEGDDE